MQINQLRQFDPKGTYSYADYLTWQLEETVELKRGKITVMAPTPKVKHQRVSGKLSWLIGSYLEDKRFEVFVALFDVNLDFGRRK